MYIQIETFTYAITSHKQRRAEYQTEMLSRMAKQQFSYKQCFQRNKTLTADTDDSKLFGERYVMLVIVVTCMGKLATRELRPIL